MVENEDFKKPFISTSYHQEIISLFDRLRLVNKKFGKVDCALITGESGVGKSELVKTYCTENPVIKGIERNIIPALRVSLKKINSDEELIRSILSALGEPPSYKKYQNYGDLLKKLILAAKQMGLEILFLDEVQRLMQKRSKHVVQSINDTFKELIDELKIPIVFIGMPWLKEMIASSSQLYERISYERSLLVYRLKAESFKDYVKLLKKFTVFYGFSDEIIVKEPKIVWRFYAATGGIMRRTANIFQSAYILREMDSPNKGLKLFAEVIEDNKKLAFLHRMNQPLENKTEDKSTEKKNEVCHFNPFTAPLTELKLYEMVLRQDFQFGSRAFKNKIGLAEYQVWKISSENKLYPLSTQSVTR